MFFKEIFAIGLLSLLSSLAKLANHVAVEVRRNLSWARLVEAVQCLHFLHPSVKQVEFQPPTSRDDAKYSRKTHRKGQEDKEATRKKIFAMESKGTNT